MVNWLEDAWIALIKMMLSHTDLKHLLGGELHPFEMSSITGASAGGINTLLSALTWCSKTEDEGGLDNRINDNVFRDIWLRIDIKTLLPPNADSPIYLPDDAVIPLHLDTHTHTHTHIHTCPLQHKHTYTCPTCLHPFTP